MSTQEPRTLLMQSIRKLSRRGILDASSGNVSLRIDGRILVTPSGIDYDDMEPGDLVEGALGAGADHRPATLTRRHRPLWHTASDIHTNLLY